VEESFFVGAGVKVSQSVCFPTSENPDVGHLLSVLDQGLGTWAPRFQKAQVGSLASQARSGCLPEGSHYGVTGSMR
jgi:hypothetical protein